MSYSGPLLHLQEQNLATEGRAKGDPILQKEMHSQGSRSWKQSLESCALPVGNYRHR